MKRIVLFFLCVFSLTTVLAQGPGKPGKPKFDPKKFETSLERFVVNNSGMTKAETAKFLPLFREMRKKEISIMESERKNRTGMPKNDKDCAAAIKVHDKMEIQLKTVQQTYHNKMLKILPATKLMKVIGAIDMFHRQAFRNFEKPGGSQGPKGGNGPKGGPRPGKKSGKK